MKRLLFFSILIQISIVTSAQSSIIYDKRANQKSEYVFSVGDTIQFFPLNPSFKETYSNKYTCFYDMRCLKHGVKSKYRFATNDGKYTPNDEIEHTYFLVKSINDAKFNEKNKLYFSAILERLEDRTLVYFAFPKDLKKEPKESVLHSWVVADSEGDYIIRKKTALVIPFLTKRVIDKYVTLEGKQLLFRNCYKEGDTESYMLEFANGKALAGDLMDRDCIYEIGHEFITNKFHFIPLGEKLNYSQPVLSISDSIRITLQNRKCLKIKYLRFLYCQFTPHLPHRIIKETHKRIRNKALYSSMLQRSGYLSLHLDFTPFSCTSLLPKIIFWQGQPCVNES